ncbi:Hypothetical protein LUCI_0488 [Lucifera butyrica]|uniref:Uncharacterized protein n=1 Tax=Lucifera butyrica TaxID=1351585 RepID=A0A498R1N9_9FIRM|nr:hypothetical protein [Lucifera butyrica]VBB05281.1 Hypothetical protein LUCI_0488 [Lucifera butyrica]
MKKRLISGYFSSVPDAALVTETLNAQWNNADNESTVQNNDNGTKAERPDPSV